MDIKHISIDIETYSSVNISEAGLYKYVQSPDFEVLLFAYSINGGQVKIIDIAQGEAIPTEIVSALTDSLYIKHAFNAAFEWYCLSKHLAIKNPTAWLSQWRCTQMHGLYLGYPRGLAALGEALSLPKDKQKMKIGESLIAYFCTPCTPTKKNGGRTRNYYYHDTEKWTLFKQYCCGDVITEVAADEKLSAFPVPYEVQRQWELDQIINSRGVRIEEKLMNGALEISENHYECSLCGWEVSSESDITFNYCPECGAKMLEREEKNNGDNGTL